MERIHQGVHRPDATAAIHAIPRVPIKAAAGARLQFSLYIVRQMLLRPPVVIASAGHAHHISRHGSGLALP
jgi:hypothetical protein